MGVAAILKASCVFFLLSHFTIKVLSNLAMLNVREFPEISTDIQSSLENNLQKEYGTIYEP